MTDYEELQAIADELRQDARYMRLDPYLVTYLVRLAERLERIARELAAKAEEERK